MCAPLNPHVLPGRLWEELAPGTGRTGSTPSQSPERPRQRKRAHFLRISFSHLVPATPASIGAQTITNGKLRPGEENHLPPGSPESESKAFFPSRDSLQV